MHAQILVLCLMQRLDNEQEFLHALPSAEMYERSYMHRDTVTHAVVASQTEFLITASADGHIKFWKKRAQGVEFAKHFRAHVGAVKGSPLCSVTAPGHRDPMRSERSAEQTLLAMRLTSLCLGKSWLSSLVLNV